MLLRDDLVIILPNYQVKILFKKLVIILSNKSLRNLLEFFFLFVKSVPQFIAKPQEGCFWFLLFTHSFHVIILSTFIGHLLCIEKVLGSQNIRLRKIG